MLATDRQDAAAGRAELDQRAREARLRLELVERQRVASLRPRRRWSLVRLYRFGSPICRGAELADEGGGSSVSGAEWSGPAAARRRLAAA